MRYPPELLQFVHEASESTLGALELARLNHVSTLRREFAELLEEWVRAEAEACLARHLLGQFHQPSLGLASPSEKALDPGHKQSTPEIRMGDAIIEYLIPEKDLDSGSPQVLAMDSQGSCYGPIPAKPFPTEAVVQVPAAAQPQRICAHVAAQLVRGKDGESDDLRTQYAERRIIQGDFETDTVAGNHQVWVSGFVLSSGASEGKHIAGFMQGLCGLRPHLKRSRPQIVHDICGSVFFVCAVDRKSVISNGGPQSSLSLALLSNNLHTSSSINISGGNLKSGSPPKNPLLLEAESIRAGPPFSVALAA